MRVFLKKIDVFSVNASSRSGRGLEVDVDRPHLPARHREIRRILVEAERLAPAAGPCLRDIARHAGHLRIVEHAEADFVARRQHSERGADAFEVVGFGMVRRGQQQPCHNHAHRLNQFSVEPHLRHSSALSRAISWGAPRPIQAIGSHLARRQLVSSKSCNSEIASNSTDPLNWQLAPQGDNPWSV